MPRQILDSVDIQPGRRGWTCIVQVIERHPVLYKDLDYYPFQKRYRNYLITDMQGTKVKAVIFDNNIDFFQRSLHPFRRYKISNAYVTIPPERYQLPEYIFSWTINTRTPFEPINDPKPYILPCMFDVCNISELHKFAESDTPVAIKALVVHRFAYTEITETKGAKDYLLVNEEEIPIVLRLWKDLLADYDPEINAYNGEPITIIAQNLEVRTFHGLSLAKRPNAYLLENPLLSEDLNMKKWYDNNKDKVANWIRNKSYENNIKFFNPPKDNNILDLSAALEAFNNVKTCWVKAKVCLGVTHRSLYYVLCASCQKIVDAEVDWNVECSGCSVLSPMEIRLSLPVILYDEKTSMTSTIKTPDAEKIYPLTALEIKKLEDEGTPPMQEIALAIESKDVVCFLKYYEKIINGVMLRRYVILRTYTTEELETLNKETTRSIVVATELASKESTPQADKAILGPAETTNLADSVNQLFTPSTTELLEKKTLPSISAESCSSQTSRAKRAITFGTITPEDLEAVRPKVLEPTTTKVLQSPTKKKQSRR